MKDRVLIIDALNFIYRGAIKFGNNDPSKQDYTIVYNFFRNLRALVEELNPNKCFLVLEGNPKFRKELFPDYKKNRIVKTSSEKESSKNNILSQASIIYKLVNYLPVTMVKADEYEADDTIYTLANDLKNEEVIIVSTDSDMIQIIQNLSKFDVKLFNPHKKDFIQIPEYVYLVWKSLAGDKSDNIPSVVSLKDAHRLSGSPDELKLFLSQEENRANFSLNKQLIELQLIPSDQLIFIEHNKNFDFLFEEFKNMELLSLLKDSYKERFITTFNEI